MKLYIQFFPSKIACKLAPAQGKTRTIHGKIQLLLTATRTMEQIEILHKPFKRIFLKNRHKTQYRWNPI